MEAGRGEESVGRLLLPSGSPRTFSFSLAHACVHHSDAARGLAEGALLERGKRSDSAGLRCLIFPSTPHFNVHPPLPTPNSRFAAVSLVDSLG